MLNVEPSQVCEFLLIKGKEGPVAGVYLWINQVNGNMYVGSSMNLRSRISYYFNSKNVHGRIGSAFRKYSLISFTLVIYFIPMPRLLWFLLWSRR